MTSKGTPKLFEKVNTRYDYGQAQKGIKSIAQQEMELRLKRGNAQFDDFNDITLK